MADKIHVGDVLAQALCDMTPRHLYKRAMRAERRAEAAEARERVLEEALRNLDAQIFHCPTEIAKAGEWRKQIATALAQQSVN